MQTPTALIPIGPALDLTAASRRLQAPQKNENLDCTSPKMSTILRTLRNLRRVGFKDAGHQMQYIGDTKAGTFIGADRYGNKYYENMAEELPLRTRWVDYKQSEYDPSQIEPGWHAWISYMVDEAPTTDKLLQTGHRAWDMPEHRPMLTLSRGAFKTYSTTRPKVSAWTPVAAPR